MIRRGIDFHPVDSSADNFAIEVPQGCFGVACGPHDGIDHISIPGVSFCVAVALVKPLNNGTFAVVGAHLDDTVKPEDSMGYLYCELYALGARGMDGARAFVWNGEHNEQLLNPVLKKLEAAKIPTQLEVDHSQVICLALSLKTGLPVSAHSVSHCSPNEEASSCLMGYALSSEDMRKAWGNPLLDVEGGRIHRLYHGGHPVACAFDLREGLPTYYQRPGQVNQTLRQHRAPGW